MRISTPSTYFISSSDMSALQVKLQHLQLQLDTQQRVVVPSDDPVATAQILSLEQSKERTNQFIENNTAVESTLALSEGVINSAIGLLTSMKTLAIQAGDGAYAPETLQKLQPQVAQGFEQLLSYANTADGTGHYLYGGNKISAPPFNLTGPFTVAYQGDNGQRQVQVASSSTLPITDPGSLLFGTAAAPTAVFDALGNLYTLLGQDPKPTDYTTQLQTIMGQLDSAQQQLVTVQASIGARRQQNEEVMEAGQGMALQYNIAISQYQDLDLSKAVPDFALSGLALEFSQRVYEKLSKLSLFSMI